MRGVLTDLDELALSVRDRVSRAYLHEAIAAYRAHALRAAVVSTWTAVTFDIISKIRELATQKDPAAVKLSENLDKAAENQDIEQQMRLERTLLDEAQKTFAFLTHAEREDLGRVRDDRNRCAHPAFDGDELYQPTPEQVRAHIVHATSHLLSQPPVQGKAALRAIMSELLQPSFPADQDQATSFLRDRYLRRAKDALVRSLVVVCLKVLIRQTEADFAGRDDVLLKCLMATQVTHPSIYSNEINDTLPRLCEGVDDATLQRVFALIGSDPPVWNRLDQPTRMRLTELARTHAFSSDEDAIVANVLSIPELHSPVLEAIERADAHAQERIIAGCPRAEFAELAVRLYSEAGGFRTAERLGERVLLPMATFFDVAQVKEVLRAIRENGQIWDAGGTPEIVADFFQRVSSHHAENSDDWKELRSFLQAREFPDYSRLFRRMERVEGFAQTDTDDPSGEG